MTTYAGRPLPVWQVLDRETGELIDTVASGSKMDLAAVTARELEAEPISEYEFLHGTPHPAAVEHMQHAIDRVKPPSLVKLDRAEVLVAAVVTWRNLELGGQHETQQWCDAIGYIRDLADRYIEATS